MQAVAKEPNGAPVEGAPASKPDVVAKEVAEQDVDRMCLARRIETDLTEMTDAEQRVYLVRRREVVKAIRKGLLDVNERGDPTFRPPGGPALTFHKLTGAAFIQSEGLLSMSTMATMIAHSTKTNIGEASKLDAIDFEFCCTLVGFFLGR